MKKLLLNLLIYLFLVTTQFVFLNSFSFPYSAIILPLVFLSVVVSLKLFSNYFLWSLVIGITWDMFSFLPFGVYLVIFPIVFLVCRFVFENYITDSSLISFALLNAVSVLTFLVTYYFALFVVGNLSMSNSLYSLVNLLQIGSVTFLSSLIIFGLIQLAFQKLMPTHV